MTRGNTASVLGKLTPVALSLRPFSDWIQSFLWGACAGTRSFIPYFYCLFFLAVLTHRCGRDFERCGRKYKQDWDKYCKIVPYR